MLIQRILGVCLAAFFIGACGGTEEMIPVPESAGTARQSLIWACTGSSTWTRRWYSDYNRTNEVGREDCYCDGTIVTYGQIGGYYSQTAGTSCSGGGGGGGGGCRVTPQNYPPPPEC